jgi:hypothetical protein
VKYGTVISVDPGLDRVSAAIFRPFKVSGTMLDETKWKVDSLASVEHVETDPIMPISARLEKARLWFRALVMREGYGAPAPIRTELIFLEVPSYTGIYARRQGSRAAQGDVTKLYMAIGALLSIGNVVTVPAQSAPKEQRIAYVKHLFKQYRPNFVLPRNKDDLDAIGIGLGADWNV